MQKKINFTEAFVRDIRPPAEGQRLVLKDAKVSGLQLRVTSNGVKTFFSRRRVKGGLSERVTLGRYDAMSVKEAQAAAEKINASIATGGSPAEAKRAHKAESTFKELFADYLDRHAKHKSRTWKKDEGRYNCYLAKPLDQKRLSQITRADIAAIHAGITRQPKSKKKDKDGKPKLKSGATANRILELTSAVFNWGIMSGLCENNPAKGIKKNSVRSRDRFLQKDELPRFFKALNRESNTAIRDYVLLSLLTGARRANVLAMRWDEISFERREWRIPRTKNDDPQTVMLVDEVIQVLNERKAALQALNERKDVIKVLSGCKDNDSDFVFPGEGDTGHLVEPKKGWIRILRDAGIDNLRLHDLRRTLGSWQARTGASLVIIGKSLNHKSLVATQVYSRLDTDPVRQSVERATGAMLEAAGVKKTAEIKQFQGRRKKK